MFQKYINFIRGVSVNRAGRVGVILTTTIFITFINFEFAQTIGLVRNAYFGLITYLAFPMLFIVGLILIPIGWQKYKKQSGKSTSELLNQRFTDDYTQSKFIGSRLFRTIIYFTLINVVILGIAGLRMLHFMDSAEFCGTACHTVMNPEWVTYQRSPHARVKCVECHVGQGVDALIASKINGVRQMYLAALNIYNRPIPTPVHTLRPARETCEHCHWPEKFYGQRLVTRVKYTMDSLSTPTFTTLNIKIDAGGPGKENGAHWHVNPENKVVYTSVDDKRLEISLVKSIRSDGTVNEYHNERLATADGGDEEERIMDCVDCHNRATHIYKEAEDIVDELIRSTDIDRELPFVKREALAAISKSYNSNESANEEIANHIQNYYNRHFRHISIEKSEEINKVVEVLQDAYAAYRHHHMRIEWGTYSSHIGHKRDSGCFRCHNTNMKSEKGESIRHDCTMCHSILAMDSAEPYQFLKEAEKNAPDRKMHEYLNNEFFESTF